MRLQNYIAGALVDPQSGKYFGNHNPATGEVYSNVPDSDERDVDAAVQEACSALPDWTVKATADRTKLLLHIAALIDLNMDRLAEAECIDNGKPLTLARKVDIPRASANFRFFATAIMHLASESHPMDGTALNYTLRQPLGVVGCISPWNLPLYLFTWKIAPALAAGNCVVGKPSELTPMTAYILSELCMEAGLPPGVLNIVHGYGAKVGAPLVVHPEVKAVSFTGGTRTGESIARSTASQFKKLSLEMGGKNPVLVFADCRYEEMLETTIRSSFANQGQICLCGSRVYVERSLYDRFRKDLIERAQGLHIGDPLEEKTQQGAVVSEAHMNKILSYIQLAQDEGGKILCGGKRVKLKGRCENGWFIEPTVIEGLSHTCRTNREEIFGPVVTIAPFDSDEEALDYANSTQYGLASVIWTENLTRAHRLAEKIETGIVWVNCWMLRDLRTPFGGTKDSGLGREGGWEALRFFTEPKNVCIRL